MNVNKVNDNISLKIYISKNENKNVLVRLDKPLKLCNCAEMNVKKITIFWDYNNLCANLHYYYYDTTGPNTKIGFKDGYYTFSILQRELKTKGIELKKIDFSGKCTIKCNKKLNLGTFGPIIGFDKDKIINANTLTESQNEVNINNNFKYINISCDLVDKSKNFFNGKRSDIIIQVPITTQQILKGSVVEIYPFENSCSLSNGIYNEIKLKFKANQEAASLESDEYNIGDILLEIQIN